MDIKEATTIITEYNKWRRGADIPQPSPETIGLALEVMLDYVNKVDSMLKEAYTDGFSDSRYDFDVENYF